MFDKILEFLHTFWEWLVPFHVVKEYEKGIVLRLGKFHREIGPGFNWFWPVGVEQVITDTVVTDTHLLEPQSLTTRDGVSMGIRGLLTFKIKDVKKLLLKVEHKENALSDCATGIIAECVAGADWAEIHGAPFLEGVQRRIRARAWRYGIEVEDVQFPDIHKMRTYHVFQHHS